MKRLHRPDLFSWSTYSEKLDIDFNAFALIAREGTCGNVLIDPLPLSAHDHAHLEKLGGAAWVVITNSDHVRAAVEVATAFGSKIAGPAAEKDKFPVACDRWLSSGDELVPGLVTIELQGSKTPGELALLLDGTTLITGDLIRSHQAGSLMLLRADQRLTDRAKAAASVTELLAHEKLEAVLVGDGFCVFRDGRTLLQELATELRAPAA